MKQVEMVQRWARGKVDRQWLKIGVFVLLVLLAVGLGLAQETPETPADPFEQAGEQGCSVIRFIFRGTGAAIILGIVWIIAVWTLFTQRGAVWGLGIAIVVSLIIQFAPAFITFFAPAVTGTCFEAPSEEASYEISSTLQT